MVQFIENPKNVTEIKVNLERAINALRKYYEEQFMETIHKQGFGEKHTDDMYANKHTMEAIHHLKLTLK